MSEECATRKEGFGKKIQLFFVDRDRPEEISKNFLARIFALVGIYIPPKGKGKIIIGQRFLRLLMLAPFAFLIFLFAFFEYSTSPRFCVSCHIMKPYYEAWKTSKHNKVPCVDCHYPPGTMKVLTGKFQAMSQVVKYITKTYSSKPYAEIDDSSCLREGCHSKRLLEGKVNFKRGIQFDHTPHLTKMRRGKQLRCTSCHSQIVVGNHIEVTEDTCFLCHFKETKKGREENPIGGCPLCHKAPQGDIKIGEITYNHRHFTEDLHVPCQKCHIDAVVGEGMARKDKCTDCHNEPWKLKLYTDTEFIHRNHVTKRKVECSRCHDPIEHKNQQRQVMLMEQDCSQCHPNKHTAHKNLFMGTGGKGSPEIPGHMFLVKVECIACHINPEISREKEQFLGQTYSASEKACTACHGNKYRGMLKDWQGTFDRMLVEISPRQKQVSRLLQTGSYKKAAFEKATKLYDDAKFNIDMVTLGKGVHNPFYAAELLQVANRNLEEASRVLGMSPLALPANGLLQGKYCATLCHARQGVKLPETVTYDGISFPHLRHATNIAPGCTTCHSPLTHKKLKRTKGICTECHHKQEKPSCSRCHPGEAGLFDGRITEKPEYSRSPNPHKRIMDCVGCHSLDEKQTRFSILQKCILCHDGSYKDVAEKIDEEGRYLYLALAEVKGKLEQKKKEKGSSQPDTDSLLKEIGRDEKLLGGVDGIHNIELFRKILSEDISRGQAILKDK